MRGLKRVRSAATITAGHAFVQNLRRGHYELTVDVPTHDRVRVAFAELTTSIRRPPTYRPLAAHRRAAFSQRNRADSLDAASSPMERWLA
jgi:hypothetical protein